MEAAGLGIFMVSACAVVAILEYPASPVRQAIPDAVIRRTLIGIAMGLTAIGITEQEHLNNVIGARLRITALRAGSGPGIEFLEYLSPRDGRPMPLDERTNDIMHWQTKLLTRDAEAAARVVRAGKFAFVSVIRVPENSLGASQGFLARDPDGHVIRAPSKFRKSLR